MRTKFKAWAEPYLNEHKEVSLSEAEIKNIKDVYLEIGSGKGDFLLQMAAKFPSFIFVGVERNVTCAGITAKKIVESGLTNAKILFVDAQELIPTIKKDAINSIFLNFSDPWPKKRHHKRRLTSVSFLNEYYRVLKKDGRLILKTDNEELFNDSIEYFTNSDFTLIEINENYFGEDDFDAITEYEKRFREQGVAIHRAIYQK